MKKHVVKKAHKGHKSRKGKKTSIVPSHLMHKSLHKKTSRKRG